MRRPVAGHLDDAANLAEDNRDHRYQKPMTDCEQCADPRIVVAPVLHRAPSQPVNASDVIRIKPVPKAQHQHQQQA